MIRIAICNHERDRALRLRGIVDAFAQSVGIHNVETVVFQTFEALQSTLEQADDGFLNVIVLRVESASDEVTSFAEEITVTHPRTHVILYSPDEAAAFSAYNAGALYLPDHFDQRDFLRTIGTCIKKSAAQMRKSFAIKSPKGIENMNIRDVTFVEANKKGPIIHLPNDRTITTRSTLQALLEKMRAADEHFVRAGGSFIINIDNVRSVGESSVVFGNGDTIILPVRARKPIREAVCTLRASSF